MMMMIMFGGNGIIVCVTIGIIMCIVVWILMKCRKGKWIWTKANSGGCVEINENEIEITIKPATNYGSTAKTKPFFPEILDKTRIPTDIQLQFIGCLVAADQCYRNVGLRLGITDNEICIIEEENQVLKTRAFKVFKKWTQKFADEATVYQLLKALEGESRSDVVKEFWNKFEGEFANQLFVGLQQ